MIEHTLLTRKKTHKRFIYKISVCLMLVMGLNSVYAKQAGNMDAGENQKTKLVVASHNPDKVDELKPFLEGKLGFDVSSAKFYNAPEAPENTGTVFGNAKQKAEKVRAFLSEQGIKPAVLSDDTGFFVHGLKGTEYEERAGVNIALIAREHKDQNPLYAGYKGAFEEIAGYLDEVGSTDYSATFVCSLVYIDLDGETYHFEAKCTGTIVFEPKGANGFGFDSFFVPDDERNAEKRTFGEMSKAEKEFYSPRAKALSLFGEHILSLDLVEGMYK